MHLLLAHRTTDNLPLCAYLPDTSQFFFIAHIQQVLTKIFYTPHLKISLLLGVQNLNTLVGHTLLTILSLISLKSPPIMAPRPMSPCLSYMSHSHADSVLIACVRVPCGKASRRCFRALLTLKCIGNNSSSSISISLRRCGRAARRNTLARTRTTGVLLFGGISRIGGGTH